MKKRKERQGQETREERQETRDDHHDERRGEERQSRTRSRVRHHDTSCVLPQLLLPLVRHHLQKKKNIVVCCVCEHATRRETGRHGRRAKGERAP